MSMSEKKIFVRAESPINNILNLYLVDIDFKKRKQYLMEPGAIREVKDGEALVSPTMQLNRNEAQFLIDQLWERGVRPSNGVGNVGQLQATEKHLEDMRRLAFKEENNDA